VSRRKRKGRGGEEESNEIDLTPMLDVVFIMLIFFIVTASFVKEVGLNVNIPPDNDQPPPDDAPVNIMIQVTSSDEIYVDNRRVDVRSIKAMIQTRHAETPDATVIISADGEGTTATYVAIADAAKIVGVPASLVLSAKKE